MTLKAAKERFLQAQDIALENNNAFGEVLALGLAELTGALQTELRKITSKLDDVERRVKRLD